MGFWKWVGNFVAGSILSLGIIIFIFGLFAHYMIADFDKLGTALDKAAGDIVVSMGENLKDTLADQMEEELKKELAQTGISDEELEGLDINQLAQGQLPEGVELPPGVSAETLSNEIKKAVEEMDVKQLLEQTKEQCKTNPNMQGCEIVSNLGISKSSQFKEFQSKVEEFDKYTTRVIIAGIIIILLGAGLFFLVNKWNAYYSLYRIGLSSAVSGTAMFVAFYFLPATVNNVVNNDMLISKVVSQYKVDASMLEQMKKIVSDIIMGWISEPVHNIVLWSVGLIVVGMVAAVTFFILNKKYPPKDLNKDSKGANK